mmetsp:Transcript_52978/g.84225  ORF Transcript_52978/g.84225 Transcript_52978/m.84225 type:complete len:175 (-) Transcript_52978:25-549(-)
MSWTCFVLRSGLFALLRESVYAARDEDDNGRLHNGQKDGQVQISVNSKSLQLDGGLHSALAELHPHHSAGHFLDGNTAIHEQPQSAAQPIDGNSASKSREDGGSFATKMATTVMDVMNVKAAASDFMDTVGRYKEWAKKNDHTPDSLEEGRHLKGLMEQYLHTLQDNDADLQKK